jgi:hypothetical protein
MLENQKEKFTFIHSSASFIFLVSAIGVKLQNLGQYIEIFRKNFSSDSLG